MMKVLLLVASLAYLAEGTGTYIPLNRLRYGRSYYSGGYRGGYLTGGGGYLGLGSYHSYGHKPRGYFSSYYSSPVIGLSSYYQPRSYYSRKYSFPSYGYSGSFPGSSYYGSYGYGSGSIPLGSGFSSFSSGPSYTYGGLYGAGQGGYSPDYLSSGYGYGAGSGSILGSGSGYIGSGSILGSGSSYIGSGSILGSGSGYGSLYGGPSVLGSGSFPSYGVSGGYGYSYGKPYGYHHYLKKGLVY